eukprot:6198451-Pleurochrysis_carterae.AAC.1
MWINVARRSMHALLGAAHLAAASLRALASCDQWMNDVVLEFISGAMDPYRVAMALRSFIAATCASEPDSSVRNASAAHVASPEHAPLRARVAARGPAASARALL